MIYIVKHKEYDNPIPKGYKELYVGTLYNGTGKNINELNLYLNEVTAMYQLRYHCDDDIIGLVHYRRFFVKDNEVLKYEDAEKILQDYDIILCPFYPAEQGIYKQMRVDFLPVERIMLDRYKNILCKRVPGIAEYFKNETRLIPRNMFVAKRELMNKYFDWMLPIAEDMTREFIKHDVNIVPQKRLLGYLFERVFGYWVFENDLKIKNIEYMEV